MIYHGKVKDGVIVFENQPPLADGTVVRIEPETAGADHPSQNGAESVWRRLGEIAGTAHGLPSDAAENHDAYRRRPSTS